MFIIYIFIIIIFGIILYTAILYFDFKITKYQKISGKNFFETYNNKGYLGEFLIFKQLKKLDKNLKILTNVYVPIGENKYSEIDILLLHETGIYTIESKNFTGWIYGSEFDEKWTQVYSKFYKYKFNNPVIQNKNHIKHLSEYLNIDEIYFKNYIVFGEQCRIKKSYVDYDNIRLLKRHSLNKIIKTEFNVSEKIFSNKHINIMYEELKKLTKKSNIVKEEHINNIKNNI